MVKIWVDKDEYHIYSYYFDEFGEEVEITEEDLRVLEEASKKMLEAQKILCRLIGSSLEAEGYGAPPKVWP